MPGVSPVPAPSQRLPPGAPGEALAPLSSAPARRRGGALLSGETGEAPALTGEPGAALMHF